MGHYDDGLAGFDVRGDDGLRDGDVIKDRWGFRGGGCGMPGGGEGRDVCLVALGVEGGNYAVVDRGAGPEAGNEDEGRFRHCQSTQKVPMGALLAF